MIALNLTAVMAQVAECIATLNLTDELNLSIGDSLYGTEVCRQTVDQQPNWLHLFRINQNRNLYTQPEPSQFDVATFFQTDFY